MTTDHYESPPEPVNLIALWYSAIGGPLAWILHNVGSYFVATVLCSVPGQELLLHGITAVTALVALGTALVGWRIRVRLREMAWPEEYRISKGRAYFMASYGVISGIFFLAVILAEGIPGILIEPCLPPM